MPQSHSNGVQSHRAPLENSLKEKIKIWVLAPGAGGTAPPQPTEKDWRGPPEADGGTVPTHHGKFQTGWEVSRTQWGQWGGVKRGPGCLPRPHPQPAPLPQGEPPATLTPQLGHGLSLLCPTMELQPDWSWLKGGGQSYRHPMSSRGEHPGGVSTLGIQGCVVLDRSWQARARRARLTAVTQAPGAESLQHRDRPYLYNTKGGEAPQDTPSNPEFRAVF